MDTQLISTPLQSSECDLERIHNDETVSSDVVEEPKSLEYPTILTINFGDPRISDEDFCTFLNTLTTFTQDKKHIAPHILDRIITILKQLQRRISSPNRSQHRIHFLFPWLYQVTDLFGFETWPWHILLSAHNTRLSVAVLDVLRKELRYISPKSVMTILRSGFISSLLSALGEESLFSLRLSDPLPDALFAFLIKLIDQLKQDPPFTLTLSSKEFASQLHDHMLVPLRPFLIRHLKYSTSFSDSERHRAVPFSRYDSHWPKKQLSPNKQYFPFLTFFRQFASLQHGQNEFVAFLAELMQEVWEERRREGLVLDGPDPLFVSTPLRTNMTPPEMVPLLDSASAILASTRPLSDFDAVTVTLFLTSFENMIFIRTEKGRVEFSSTFADSLSSCPPFARSLATLILLSLTSSPFESWAERREFWLDCIFSQQFNLMSVANHVFFPLLAEEAQTLQTGWSDESILEVHSFFTDIVELSVRMITPCGSTLKTDSDIEHFQKTQQIVVSNVLAPLRQSLVLFARTNTRIVPHFDFLSFQEINHPNIVRFFSGVWEEVRREAIEVVCGEDEAEAPVFLTMDLFSCLSMEETELGLSSLSSYLSTTPSPPQIVIACIHLFLRTITNVSSLSLSEQKKIRARSAWARIDSQLQVWIRSHRSFAFCFSETVPTLLLSRNDDIQVDSRWMVDFILEYSSNPSEIVLSLAEAGLVSNLALVLMNTQSRTNSRDFIKHANSRCFLKIVKASLSVIPTSVHMSFKDQLRENERRARILVEKVLVPSQPFLISLLAPLSLSRGVDEAISDLKELLLAIGTAEWYCPKLTESLARCGFHVATMRLCDLTEKTEFQVCLLALTVNPKYDSGIINRHQSSSKAVNSASSKLTVPTLRERMKGRNEEGQEDLIEEVMLGRPLTDYFRDIQSRTNRFINNTGFNTFR